MSVDVKMFKDPVHGTIQVPRLLLKIIDTCQFQRLRGIKQMGGKYFVYPGVSHNRFEHSIGVSYIAGEFLKTLSSNQPDLDISPTDILCVQIAGLCHDLGHGPFSHVFDSMVTPQLDPDNDWKHEDASVLMFEYLLDQPLPGCSRKEEGAAMSSSQTLRQVLLDEGFRVNSSSDQTDVVFIKELIMGCPIGQQHLSECDPTKYQFSGRSRDKWFLYEIVANKFTGVDVDKWDYFARDFKGLGLSYDFDWKRYISLCKVLFDPVLGRKTICACNKEVISLYDMFHAREMLHRKALQLESCVSIELMLADALLAACRLLHSELGLDVKKCLLVATNSLSRSQISEAMQVFENLSDSLLQSMQLLEQHKNRASEDQSIATVTEVMRRVHERRLYSVVGSIAETRPGVTFANVKWKESAVEIKKRLEQFLVENELTRKDIHVYVAKYDYGMQDRDPLGLLRTYRKKEVPPIPRTLTDEEQSRMLPSNFEEKCVRLYCKDPNKCPEVKRLFREWCSDHDFNSSSGSSSGPPSPMYYPYVPSSSIPFSHLEVPGTEALLGAAQHTPEKTPPPPTVSTVPSSPWGPVPVSRRLEMANAH